MLSLEVGEIEGIPEVHVLPQLADRMILPVRPSGLLRRQPGDGLFLRDERVLLVMRLA